MKKVKSVWFLSLEKYALFGQGSGLGVGRGGERERGDITNFPYGFSHLCHQQDRHSGNAVFLAWSLVAQGAYNRAQAGFSGWAILPKQLELKATSRCPL